jgi:hypothetical protein
MPLSGSWRQHPHGHYSKQKGHIRLVVEKVGAGFRVLVVGNNDSMKPDEILFSGGAANATDAMEIAERAADRLSGYLHVESRTP